MRDLAPGSGAAPRPAAPPEWLLELGPLARRRPPPSLGRALAGAGGALVGAGAVTMAGERWAATGSSALAVPLAAAVLVAGVAAMVRAAPAPAVAGVAATGITAPALAFFVSAGGGVPSVREVALLAGILLAGLYFVGPWRGHTFHLTVLVAAGWLFGLSLADLGPGRDLVGGFGTLSEAVAEAGVASLAVGGLYLAAGRWLHRAGLEGMATPFLGVACVALPVGALAIVHDGGEVAGGVVAAAVGASASAVGGLCGRRGTVWIGVGLAAAGAVAVVRDLAPDGAAVPGLLVAAAGAGAVALAPLAARTVGEAVAVTAGGTPGTGPPPTSPPIPPPAPASTRPRRLAPEHRVRRPRPPDPPDRTGA